MKKISFIGLGIMGSRMAANLLKTNCELTVYNRTQEKVKQLIDQGALFSPSMEEAVKNADIVFTMLANPFAVKEMSSVFLPFMKKDKLWVDCSTVSPENSLHSKKMAIKCGIRFLEAPVAGTKQPAQTGDLVFFLGGDRPDQEEISPFTRAMGKKSIDMGVISNAAKIKLLVNLMLAHSITAFAETVKLGTAMGLPTAIIHNILLATPVTAPFLQNIREKLESKDTSPNFPLELMYKDLGLIKETAETLNLTMPFAEALRNLFNDALQENRRSEDFSSIYHSINRKPITL